MAATPGPWGLSRAIEVWVMAGPLHVATIPRAGDGDWSEANARLIAAAPDLLEALRDAADEIEHLRKYANNNGAMIDDERCDYARAAIAKATGDK